MLVVVLGVVCALKCCVASVVCLYASWFELQGLTGLRAEDAQDLDCFSIQGLYMGSSLK